MSYNRILVKQDSRLSNLIDYKMRVITQDGRVYIGQLMAFDKHLNVVLSDCVEERIAKTQLSKLKDINNTSAIKVEKRVLGLVILRGEQILSTVVEDKPLINKKERLTNEKKQNKQLKKQRNQRSNKNEKGKIGKPSTSAKANNDNHNTTPSTSYAAPPPETRKFQPPPGFKRR